MTTATSYTSSPEFQAWSNFARDHDVLAEIDRLAAFRDSASDVWTKDVLGNAIESVQSRIDTLIGAAEFQRGTTDEKRLSESLAGLNRRLSPTDLIKPLAGVMKQWHRLGSLPAGLRDLYARLEFVRPY